MDYQIVPITIHNLKLKALTNIPHDNQIKFRLQTILIFLILSLSCMGLGICLYIISFNHHIPIIYPILFIIGIIIGAIRKIYQHNKIKYYYINIFNQDMNGTKYEELVNQTKTNPKFKIINVPINIDAINISNDKIYIYQYANKEHTFYKLLTIINRKDPNFDDKLFWRTHTTPAKKYLLGLTDQPYNK